MPRVLSALLFLMLLLVGAAALLWRTWSPESPPAPGGLTVAETLGGEAAEGYARAFEPRPFRFPQDHGPHPEFRTEWWYFTGNLQDASGRHFGYQLTFFRVALAPQMPERSSDWAARHVYMAHFALTDAGEGRFHHSERFSRAALGLAGAQAHPFRVWLEDWSAEGEGEEGEHPFPLRLRAAEGEVAVDLRLEAQKPPVLQGDEGLSQKSDEPGNASYYYSFTRLSAAGTVRIGEASHAVRGTSWLDREWSTSALGEGDVGWDWFSLQLSDGRDIMFYLIRREDGSASPWSKGVLVEADGTSSLLALEEVDLQELARWRSPHSGAAYPSQWRLQIPGKGVDLEITPLLADQELLTTVRYWEGAVGIRGSSRGVPVSGNGYVEMTGYE